MEGWDHQLMGLADAFMTLWSHIGVGHGPNSGVVTRQVVTRQVS